MRRQKSITVHHDGPRVAEVLNGDARAEVRRVAAEELAKRAGVLTIQEVGRRGGARQTPAQRAAWARNQQLGQKRPRTVALAWRDSRAHMAQMIRVFVGQLQAAGADQVALADLLYLVERAEAAPCPPYSSR